MRNEPPYQHDTTLRPPHPPESDQIKYPVSSSSVKLNLDRKLPGLSRPAPRCDRRHPSERLWVNQEDVLPPDEKLVDVARVDLSVLLGASRRTARGLRLRPRAPPPRLLFRGASGFRRPTLAGLFPGVGVFLSRVLLQLQLLKELHGPQSHHHEIKPPIWVGFFIFMVVLFFLANNTSCFLLIVSDY